GLKSSVGLAFFTLSVEPFKLLLQPPPMERADFASKWSSLDATNEVKLFVPSIAKFATSDAAEVKSVLGSFNVGIVAMQANEKVAAFYGAVRTHLSITALVEIVASKENPSMSTLSVKSLRSADIVPAVVQVLEAAAQRLSAAGGPKRESFF
ncbi:MAG: hypothetical protein Q8J97_11795, partial [Flavobacteriaceae bacterium]|nr:hypothetical protein [Flavobacteriaceae bacterium]